MTLSDCKLAFIGGGNMGGAIIRGLAACGLIRPSQITVVCKHTDKYPSFEQIGVRTAVSVSEAITDADFIFLCVKPAMIAGIVTECVRAASAKPSATYVSIAASVPISLICDAAGETIPVVRTMPSMPMTVGEGTVAICKNDAVQKKAFELVCRMFSAIATVLIMEEDKLNPVISVNGSSPAYVYLFIKSLLDGAAAQGICAEQALPLILRTIVGSVKMVERCDRPIEELIRSVCSPGGTTLAAMQVFEDADLAGIVQRAMAACTERANEITASLEANSKA